VHDVSITNRRSAARYFKNYKLDYPNNDINKASKKYVKAMKKLHVRTVASR
jgi:dual-specificity kinase